MAHGIQTLGQLLAENSVDKRNGNKPRHLLPDPETADRMPMNRAEARRMVRLGPRHKRTRVFGRWRKR